MAEFNHPELEARFTLPDEPTIRLLLLYDGAIARGLGSEMFSRLWDAAKLVIDEWECESVTLDVNIDEAGDHATIEIIEWAGLATFSWREAMKAERLPKN